MSVTPKKAYGVGELVLIDIYQNKAIREEFDKLFDEVEGLSRKFCAVLVELQDAYRIWSIYGMPYTSGMRLAGGEREERADLLSLWTEALITRTVRLTDKSKESVSVFQLLSLNLKPDLKKQVKKLTEKIEDKSKLLRTTKDKFISHKDFVVAEHKLDIYNPGFTIHDIADILELIGDVLKCIYIYYSRKDDIGFICYYQVHDKIKY